MDGLGKRGREADGLQDQDPGSGEIDGPVVLESLSRAVSPPRKRARPDHTSPNKSGPPPLRSPFRLTAIPDLPPSANVDTLTLRDVLGSPDLVECWSFNYLFDLPFMLDALDADARQRGIDLHVVHGFWKREDERRTDLVASATTINRALAASKSRSRITLHTAYMPGPFGTHHTKMTVLVHADNTAQVCIGTANMVRKDWEILTQAVWRSPRLPQLDGNGIMRDREARRTARLGSGQRFKNDLLNYLRAYNTQRLVCTALVQTIERFDFAAVCGVLVGSVPGNHSSVRPDEEDEPDAKGVLPTPWGWPRLEQVLRRVPVRDTQDTEAKAAEIVIQVSSVATLGPNNTWLRRALFGPLSGCRETSPTRQPRPSFRLVFPVPDEIRRSVGGYASGGSIHMKIESPQQRKQLAYLRPYLCHWANDVASGAALPDASTVLHRDAGRSRAAPHIKTYIRYAPDGCLDWALLTSANLSRQAWGEARSDRGDVRVASYELGVLVWPELLAGAGATMKPVFQRDTLDTLDTLDSRAVVPLRLPYNLPLQPYGPGEVPWVAAMDHAEPDWKGEVYGQGAGP